MKKSLWFLTSILFPALLCAEPCYLTVEKSGNFDSGVVHSMAKPLVSQYIEPISPVPNEGFSDKDCYYRINVNESRQGFTVSISGKLNALGDSQRVGMEGLREALLHAIYQGTQNQGTRSRLCQDYAQDLVKVCSPQQFNSKIMTGTPPAPQAGPTASLPTRKFQAEEPTPTAVIHVDQENPQDAQAAMFENGIRNLVKQGKYGIALKRINQALKKHPDAPRLFMAKGQIFRRMGENQKAKIAFEKACALGAQQACSLVKGEQDGRPGYERGNKGQNRVNTPEQRNRINRQGPDGEGRGSQRGKGARGQNQENHPYEDTPQSKY
ncbi:tetratricopeptide repeat protein [Deltaproteobacteria bacterium TL4]